MALDMAGLEPSDIEAVEVEDRFAFLEPLFLEEAGLAGEGQAVELLEHGDLSPGAALQSNASGGSQSIGVLLEATGGARLLEAYLQLLGAAEYPSGDVSRMLVASWRGPPTYTSMAVVLSSE